MKRLNDHFTWNRMNADVFILGQFRYAESIESLYLKQSFNCAEWSLERTPCKRMCRYTVFCVPSSFSCSVMRATRRKWLEWLSRRRNWIRIFFCLPRNCVIKLKSEFSVENRKIENLGNGAREASEAKFGCYLEAKPKMNENEMKADEGWLKRRWKVIKGKAETESNWFDRLIFCAHFRSIRWPSFRSWVCAWVQRVSSENDFELVFWLIEMDKVSRQWHLEMVVMKVRDDSVEWA